MAKTIDLHIHSCFSEDADLPVEEIFRVASENSISAISIADHDSIQSIEQAKILQCSFPLEYVPGVEITTVFSMDGSQQHILGYYIDDNSPELKEALKKIEEFRIEITRERIESFKNMGFSLNEERIWKMAEGRPPGATSIIYEILKNKNNKDDGRIEDYIHGEKKEGCILHFYKDFLTEGKPAYVPFRSLSVEEGIDVIKKSGGIAVLAHPKFVKDRDRLDIITNAGIEGIEAVSTYHDKDDIEFYKEYAAKKNLLITAGSDFHGPTAKPHIKLGAQQGMDYSYFERLREFHDRKG